MLKRLRDIAIYAIAVLAACGLALSMVFGFGALAKEVQAAQSVAAPATSDNCTLEGTVAGIETFFCEGDMGPDYTTNTVGFTVVVE